MAFAALVALPVHADVGDFGTFVGPADVDATQPFAAAGFACVLGPAGAGTCLAFLDIDGDGAFDSNETAYLDLDADLVADRFELRLTPLGALPAFSQVRPADPDSGEGLTLAPLGQLAFYDQGANGAWSLDDSFYADMDGSARVTPGDVRLAGDAAFLSGTRVATGDADERRRLTVPAAVPTLRSIDLDGSTTQNLGDGMYVDQDGAAPVAAVVFPEDLRLSRMGSLPPGRVAQPADGDVTHVVQGLPGTPVFGFDDANGNGAFDSDEAFYLFDLTDADGIIAPGDLRLTARFGREAGQPVRPTDADAGFLVPPTAQRALAGAAGTTTLAYYDAEGDASWSVQDWVYVDADLSASVSPGDVRLTRSIGGSAGTRVLSVDADENRPLASAATGFGAAVAAGNLGFLDADNSGALNVPDTLYLLQAAGAASPRREDLRLSALDAAHPAGTFVDVRDPDNVVTVGGALAGPVFAFLDDNGNRAFDQDEPMFLDGLSGGPGAVDFGDLIVSPGSLADLPGQQITGSDPRIGSGLFPVGGAAVVQLYDTDGDSFWSVTDRPLLDVDGNGLVSAGDIRLTPQEGQPAGSRVRSGSADEGRTVVAVPGLSLVLYDADMSTAPLYTLCDQVYVKPGSPPGGIRVEDFRLGGTATSCAPARVPTTPTSAGATTSGTPPSPTTTPFSPTPGTPDPSAPASSPQARDGDGGSAEAPASGPALVVALAAGLALARRQMDRPRTP